MFIAEQSIPHNPKRIKGLYYYHVPSFDLDITLRRPVSNVTALRFNFVNIRRSTSRWASTNSSNQAAAVSPVAHPNPSIILSQNHLQNRSTVLLGPEKKKRERKEGIFTRGVLFLIGDLCHHIWRCFRACWCWSSPSISSSSTTSGSAGSLEEAAA